ncbi:MAG: ABC transporter ATP-binding protein [Desulfobacteraceae bacterium]|jgi:iron complex transport system ATP-binding protein|nr:ABC transporter ATP-binding protein [Desulfobacteraceae bacterium]
MAVKLACRSITFRYGKTDILHDISFSVKPGSFCAILGRNGSGKTTLLHCLNGIHRPHTGKIFINNKNLAVMPRNEIARHVSLVPQEHLEIFPFKVIDVVVMGRAPFIGMTRTPSKKDYQLALKALETFNARKLAGCNFNKISGGERQIALLASAIVQTSEIMLLDEPTNHLDFNNQYLLLKNIKQLCKSRETSVIASMHDPNMAMLFADAVVMIKNGKIIAHGPAKNIMTKENIDTLYDTNTATLAISKTKHFFLPDEIING